MIVKIRDTFYSAKDEPILLLFDDSDIQNIRNMPEGNRVLCIYPDHMDQEVVKNWMNMKEPEKIMKPQNKIIVPRRGFKR